MALPENSSEPASVAHLARELEVAFPPHTPHAPRVAAQLALEQTMNAVDTTDHILSSGRGSTNPAARRINEGYVDVLAHLAQAIQHLTHAEHARNRVVQSWTGGAQSEE